MCLIFGGEVGEKPGKTLENCRKRSLLNSLMSYTFFLRVFQGISTTYTQGYPHEFRRLCNAYFLGKMGLIFCYTCSGELWREMKEGETKGRRQVEIWLEAIMSQR